MKHPDKWRDTIDLSALQFHNFIPMEILGYPHAGNDVFYVKGLTGGKEIHAFVKAARQKGADIENEVSILSQLHSRIIPKVIDDSLDGTPYVVTEELAGERLSVIVGDNKNLESLAYLAEYGAALAKIHQLDIKAAPVKDRRFFHSPSRELLEALGLAELEDCFSLGSQAPTLCFCHGDFHYANILWNERHISGILDFELAGTGNREFDIAWAVFRRPGQKFLLTETELQVFLKGYREYGTCSEETIKTYMAQCYVYFLDACRGDAEYCTYVRNWLKQFALDRRQGS